MKKTLVFVLSLTIMLLFTACKSNDIVKSQINEKKFFTKGKGAGKKITGAELVKNIHARKAIAYAIDKNYLTSEIIKGGAYPVDFYIPKDFAKHNGQDFREHQKYGWYHFNEKYAQREWELAKKELGFNRVRVRVLTFRDNDNVKTVSDYIKSQLEEVLTGIDVKLIKLNQSAKREVSSKGDFDIELLGWKPDYPDPMTYLDMWCHTNSQNTIGFNNHEYNEIIKACKGGKFANKLDERWHMLQKAEKILVKDSVALVPLSQSSTSYVQRSYLYNVARHKFGAAETYKDAIISKFRKGKRIINLCSVSEINTLDPTKAINVITFNIYANCMENLVMLDENDDVTAGVAKNWEVSKDGKTYTFYLRNSNWSNGYPVTANDFVYSWQRLADPKTNSPYRHLIENLQIKNFRVVLDGKQPVSSLGIKAVDNNTLEVNLERPVPYFLKTITLASFSPINQQYFEEQGAEFGKTEKNIIYNGAYILTNVQQNYGYSLIKNKNYWDEKNVNNDEVNFRKAPKIEERLSLYESGEIDAVKIRSRFLELYRTSSDYQNSISSDVNFMVFNLREE